MEHENNKPMTLDRLAGMVARGFGKTEERFDHMEGRLDRVDQRLDHVEQRLGTVEQRLGTVDLKIDEVHEILARFEEGDILDLQKRIKILERAAKAIAKQVA